MRPIFQVLAVFAVAGAIVAGLILLTGGGKDHKRPSAGTVGRGGVVGAAENRALFIGLPETGTTLGDLVAPLTLTEYADPQCPFCRDYALGVLPTIIKRYVRTGKLRLELRPIAVIGPNSADGVRAIAAAYRQNRMWQLADMLYRNQGPENSGWITPSLTRRLAATVPGLDPAKVAKGTGDTALDPVRAPWIAEAQRRGVNETPTFFINGIGVSLRRLKVGSLTPGAFTRAIDPLLAG